MTVGESAASALTRPSRLGANYWKLFSASGISNLGDGIGLIAYPWLASAVTRNAVLIALVTFVQRLPWLLFSLPAGVITDRVNRRTLMMRANIVRAVLTLGVALLVLSKQSSLPSPDQLEAGLVQASTDYVLYGVVLLATLLLGMAEVLYDNAGQTFMPAIVEPGKLEKANGRLWSVEMVANSLVGPPLGSLLLVLALSVPFFADAGSFAISAVLITLIPKASTPVSAKAGGDAPTWRADLTEGFKWLWGHDLLRPMAIILGLMNMLGTMAFALIVLYGQEVLGTSPTEFAIMGTGGAIGGVVGGWAASKVSEKIGSGPSLALALIGGGATAMVNGLTSDWPVVWVMSAIFMFLAVLWNVITVSLRQTIIPDRLLGRVNSVYRFFAWGMMPIGAFLGGLIVVVAESFASREVALRLPWIVSSLGHIVLLVFVLRLLTTSKIEAARVAVVTAD